MRSKREIERQLEHFKNGTCHHTGSTENEIWIQALEWVLGDADHQKAYATWLDTLNDMAKTSEATPIGERVKSLALLQALQRL
jgi:hypothetical protein